MITTTQRPLYWLIAGFTIWAVAFCLLYAVQALGCAYDFGAWHRLLLIGIYGVVLLALAGIALFSARAQKSSPSTLALASVWANRAALASAILIFAPVTFASTCL